MESTPPPPSELHLENLKALRILGKGAMGTVFLVYDQEADPSALCPFALKVVDKSSLHTKHDADRRARWEIQVLRRFSNPFLPQLLGSLENEEFLAWAVPYCSGGDLNVLRYRQTDGVFSPTAIRFYLAEVVCALEYLHNMGIVYRDLKPENILIQQSGHVTLTDFDLSRTLAKKTITYNIQVPEIPNSNKKHRRMLTIWMQILPENNITGLKKTKSARVSPVSRRKPSFDNGERSHSFVGTEEYVSPEVVRGDGHEFAVDWWALGILTYEMMYGTTPFRGKNRKETFRNVVMKTPEFIGKRTELTDLIERLLEKDPTRRLGYQRGACEIKEHVFFRGVRWDLLTEVLRPPCIPSRDEADITSKVTANGGGVDIREHFQNMKALPSSIPSSPSTEACRRKESFTEY